MSQWLQWLILTAVTGRPILSAILLLVFWYAVDRVTFRFLPSPVRILRRWRRLGQLQRDLSANPHDRRARLELAELQLERGRYREAVEVLRPNLDAGDDDPVTVYTMGVACLGAGYAKQGEALLDALEEHEPGFRHGAIDLERGRWRLKRGDARGAREALERFVGQREGTVEGRVLLARAVDLAGDDAGAALVREAAWREYVAAPRFQRNRDRMWAWRARPSRPLLYAAILLVALGVLVRVGAPVLTRAGARAYPSEYSEPADE